MGQAIEEIWGKIPTNMKALVAIVVSFTSGGGAYSVAQHQLGTPDKVDSLVVTVAQTAEIAERNRVAVQSVATRVVALEVTSRESLELLKSLDRQFCVQFAENDRERSDCAARGQDFSSPPR